MELNRKLKSSNYIPPFNIYNSSNFNAKLWLSTRINSHIWNLTEFVTWLQLIINNNNNKKVVSGVSSQLLPSAYWIKRFKVLLNKLGHTCLLNKCSHSECREYFEIQPCWKYSIGRIVQKVWQLLIYTIINSKSIAVSDWPKPPGYFVI